MTSIHILLFLATMFQTFVPSHAFASWFMAACLTDLWDTTDEIIMGHYIVPYGSKKNTDGLHLVVLDHHSEEEIEKNDNGGGDTLIHLDGREYEEHDDGSIVYKFVVELRVDTEDLKNLQYVMDAKPYSYSGIDDDNDRDNDDEIHNHMLRNVDEHAHVDIQPQFTSHRNGCNQRRVYGTSNDGHLRQNFQIKISKSKREEIASNGNVNGGSRSASAGVKLIAGWACEREAVKLTEPVTFVIYHRKTQPVSDSSEGEL